ncbi:hypothetical protein DXM27_17025 [Rhizobium rhizogenes]|uniref:Uncharacterized protein n=2 Tax=Rhizobiaceae TaxID=82115 RepID=A0AA88JP85_RHIRH|nr:hypothetical protein DXM27_17025 [Rhizobium rhizogenes]MQB10719.1 hypothetical protein [Agrobacterium sp. ICMP 6402]
MAVFASVQKGYDGSMKALTFHPLKFILASLAAAASLAIVLLAFDGWVRHSTDIFLSTVQSGIAWCL